MILKNNKHLEVNYKTYIYNINVPSNQGNLIESSFKILGNQEVSLISILDTNSYLNKNRGFIDEIEFNL